MGAPQLNLRLTEHDKDSYKQYFLKLNNMIPVKRRDELISVVAEKYRKMPAGTKFPGKVSFDRTPYLREPVDNMSPGSPIQRTVVMKGAQLGFTFGIECIECYYIGYRPAQQLHVTAGTSLIKKWRTGRLEPAIDSYGYRHLIFHQSETPNSKTSGDTTFSKEYAGGQFDITTAASSPGISSSDKQVLCRDELDRTKLLLDTGEGSWLEASEARTNMFGDSRKIFDCSTPALSGQSLIHPMYEEGDMRQFLIPCPLCGKFQLMVWKRFKPDNEGGKLKQVYYLCEHCEDAFFEYQKPLFLSAGKWEPTRESDDPWMRSYHLPAWYAPFGGLSWYRIYSKYLTALKNPSDEKQGMRSFKNLYEGLPYEDEGARPKVENVIELRGTYKPGVVQDGVLFLTAVVDVQTGSKRTDLEGNIVNPARLEMEILAHGARYRTWSIDYIVFPGEVENAMEGAWADLDQYFKDHPFYKRDDGQQFNLKLILVDATDGKMSGVVYQCASQWERAFPIINFHTLKTRKDEKTDPMTTSNIKRYRLVKNHGNYIYEISTNFYKHRVYANLKIQKRDANQPQRAGLCLFPKTYGKKYFDMLTAEDKLVDGSFKARGRRNEAFDIRVYGLAAGDIYLDNLVLTLKAKYKNNCAPEDLQKINHVFTLNVLAKMAKVSKEFLI